MAQAVSRRPLTAEARVRSRVSPCWCGGQRGIGTGFSPSTSVFPCQFHSIGAPLLGKEQQIIIFIFIIGLHNKPHGCSASVASAAGPFTTKKKKKKIDPRLTFGLFRWVRYKFWTEVLPPSSQLHLLQHYCPALCWTPLAFSFDFPIYLLSAELELCVIKQHRQCR
jgi:hypothetical protein